MSNYLLDANGKYLVDANGKRLIVAPLAAPSLGPIWVAGSDGSLATLNHDGSLGPHATVGDMSSLIGICKAGSSACITGVSAASGQGFALVDVTGSLVGSFHAISGAIAIQFPSIVNGEIWMLDLDVNHIYRFNTDGSSAGADIVLSASGYQGPSGHYGAAAALDLGSDLVWIALNYLGKILQLHYDGTSAGSEITPPEVGPQAFAFDGTHVWLASSGGDGSLTVLATDGSTIADYNAPSSAQYGVNGIAYIDGRIWAANQLTYANDYSSGPTGDVTIYNLDGSMYGSAITDPSLSYPNDIAAIGT